MLFEVVNRLGNTVMQTQYETCVYDTDDLTSLHKAGYRFKVDGKFVNLGKVLSAVKESAANSEPIEPTSPVPEKAEVVEEVVASNPTTVSATEEVQVENSVEEVEAPIPDKSAAEEVESVMDRVQKPTTTKLITARPSSGKKFVIRCKETGQTWEKQSWAAKELDIDAAQVSDSIKTGKTRSGYTFEKIEVDA